MTDHLKVERGLGTAIRADIDFLALTIIMVLVLRDIYGSRMENLVFTLKPAVYLRTHKAETPL